MAFGPIETYYRGIKFRSKNEAKWACFFDNAKIKYEYEPRLFIGWTGAYYKPDFYLPDYKKYAEVKSYPDAIQEKDMAEKLNSVIDYQATDVSKGLLLLGSFPYDIRIVKGLWMEMEWLYWHEGVCSGRATISDIYQNGALVQIHFIQDFKDSGDPIPPSAKTEVITRQDVSDDSETIYRIIEKVNNTIK